MLQQSAISESTFFMCKYLEENVFSKCVCNNRRARVDRDSFVKNVPTIILHLVLRVVFKMGDSNIHRIHCLSKLNIPHNWFYIHEIKYILLDLCE